MYLVRLYHFNKPLFFFCVFFICVQLYINAKIGVTATPFLHYGMYAAKSHRPAFIEAWEIQVNNKKLALPGFHPKIVDNILEPLNKFSNLAYDYRITYESKRFLTSIYIPYNESNFHSSITKEQFHAAYLKHLRKVLNLPINEVIVYRNTYKVNGADLSQTGKTLFAICR